MTAQTGRTNAKHITVKLDNSGGTLTDISAYTNNVGTVGLNFDSTDVTAFSDGVKNVTIGQPEAPLTIGGPFDTVSHAQMIAINGGATPLSLDIQIGIRHAWESGEPQFGISSSATSGYLMTGYTIDPQAQTWTATLNVFGPTAPAFGTAAET
jgi:hypothetical protein